MVAIKFALDSLEGRLVDQRVRYKTDNQNVVRILQVVCTMKELQNIAFYSFLFRSHPQEGEMSLPVPGRRSVRFLQIHSMWLYTYSVYWGKCTTTKGLSFKYQLFTKVKNLRTYFLFFHGHLVFLNKKAPQDSQKQLVLYLGLLVLSIPNFPKLSFTNQTSMANQFSC